VSDHESRLEVLSAIEELIGEEEILVAYAWKKIPIGLKFQ